MSSANGTVNATLNVVRPINVSSHKLRPVVFGSIQISKVIFISAIAKFYYNDQTRIYQEHIYYTLVSSLITCNHFLKNPPAN